MRAISITIPAKPDPRVTMPESPIQRAVRLGRYPYPGVTGVFMCGACRNVRVTREMPVCRPCYKMLLAQEAEPIFPVKVIALLIGIGLAAVGVTLAGIVWAGWFV